MIEIGNLEENLPNPASAINGKQKATFKIKFDCTENILQFRNVHANSFRSLLAIHESMEKKIQEIEYLSAKSNKRKPKQQQN